LTPFEVVFICTGNRFRSPIAAELFRNATAGLPVVVRSLGVSEIGPEPVLPEALDWAARYELDLAEHRAAAVMGADLSGTDLVLGFERSHVGTAILDGRAQPAHTFLLTELVELVGQPVGKPDADPVEHARALVASAHEARLGLRPTSEEVPDPLGGPRKGYGEVGDRVRVLTLDLASALFGV
jgi:protein-tyrosine phosphatase